MVKLKFFWQGTDEQVAHLKRLARATGHASIRDLFGTCVSAGLATIERTIAEDRARLEAEAKAAVTQAGTVKSEAGAADENIVQVERAQSAEVALSEADVSVTP